MKLGAEPKKVAILGALLAVAAISAYINLWPSSPATKQASRTANPRPTGGLAPTAPLPGTESAGSATTPRGGALRRAAGAGSAGGGEFRPVFKTERGGAALDPTKVDPALHLEQLAKLREVRLRGGSRNLFQFGEAPPPPRPPEPKIIPKPLGQNGLPVDAGTPERPIEPVKPPPPPIPLRYYGYADPRQPKDKRAFFMEGEDIQIAAEGELIKKRYRVIEITPRSAVVEDTEHSNRQTLALQSESGS